MMDYTGITNSKGEYVNLQSDVHQFIFKEILPAGVDIKKLSELLPTYFNEFSDTQKDLLQERTTLQSQIDTFLRNRRDQGVAYDPAAMLQFMRDIGYIVKDGDDFKISTTDMPRDLKVGR